MKQKHKSFELQLGLFDHDNNSLPPIKINKLETNESWH